MSLQRLISRVRNEFTRNISFIILFLVGIAFVLLFVQYRHNKRAADAAAAAAATLVFQKRLGDEALNKAALGQAEYDFDQWSRERQKRRAAATSLESFWRWSDEPGASALGRYVQQWA